MFSSPGRTPTGRRRQDALASARSSRAGTPAAGAATRAAGSSSMLLNPAKSRQSYRPSYAAGRQSAASETGSVATTATARRRDRRRSLDGGQASVLEPGTVLSRDDNHAVSVFSRLPVEAATALASASAYDAVRSGLDADVGFAYLVVHGRCLVWSFLSRALESPTCFAYDLSATFQSRSSTSSSSSETLAHCSFVPKGADREPGILLVSHSGSVRYGESVSNILAFDRANASRSAELGLGSDEGVARLERCSNNVFVVATSYARLIGIRLVASGGHLQPVVGVFAQPRGIFGRLFGAAAANIATGTDGVVSLVSSPSSANENASSNLYVISRQAIQKWTISEGRGESIVYETDVSQLIRLRDDRISEGSHASETLKLHDGALTSSGALLLLYSLAFVEGGVQHFGLATLTEADSSAEARLNSISHLQYSCMPDSRPYSQPRLTVPLGGKVAFIVFSEAVIFRIVDDKDGLEESIELRDVSTNRFLGYGVERANGKAAASDVARISLVSQRSGQLLVEVDVAAASQMSDLIATGEDRTVVDTHRLKTKLERGVFHADNALNPISFDLPLDIRGDLMTASEQLSDDILNSESPSLVDTLDTRIQLANRFDRLRSLATFLSLNGLLGTMTQNSLRRLSADAQLLAAGVDLWEYVNELLGEPDRLQRAGNILAGAVEQVMDDEAVDDDDILRSFFRDDLRKFNAVLQHVQTIARAANSDGIVRHSAVVTEVNRILLTTFQAAWRYRTENAELYRLDSKQISFEAWTCSAGNVSVLQDAVSATATLIRERTRQMGGTIDQEMREVYAAVEGEAAGSDYDRYTQLMLKGQLCELTGQLLNVYEERLAFLSLAGSTNPSLQREHASLSATYDVERRTALLALVAIARADRALYLAEQHRDFASLTELCSGPTSSDEQRSHRLRHYLNKYGEPFAVALFTFYTRTGQMFTLLTQDPGFYPLLQRFLYGEPGLNRVAWLHDLALGQQGQAAGRLLVEAGQERDSTSSKRLMLSLAKLCHVSQLDEVQIATQTEQGAIEEIDDQLDLINVHNRIRKTFFEADDEQQEASLTIGDDEEGFGGEDLELAQARAEDWIADLAHTKPGSASLYTLLVAQLLARRPLLSEDLIDLLTLHDPTTASHADLALSLEVFVRARDMPAVRAQATLASLWRRTLLFDDWSALTQTKGMSDQALNEGLRQTALYALIASATGNQATSDAVLDVEQMLLPPSADAVEARLAIVRAGLNDGQRERLPTTADLVREGKQECDAVQALLRDRDLNRWYAEVRRLVEEDVGSTDGLTMDASREIELAAADGVHSFDGSDKMMMM